MTKPKEDVLTPKQRVFVGELVKGASQTAAAEAAGYKHPHVTGSTVLSAPGVRAALDKAFADRGLDDDFLAQKVYELCCATDDEGAANWVARARGADLLCRIKGAFKPAQVETTSVSFEMRLLAIVGHPTEGELDAIDGNLGAATGQLTCLNPAE